MLKLDIITLVLIALITLIILYCCHLNFRENLAVYPLIENNFYSHIYFTNVVNKREDNLNIYFIANKKAGDNKHIYFMNHNLQIVKKIKPPNPDDFDTAHPDFKMTDDEITNLSFVIKFHKFATDETNNMTIMKLKKSESIGDSNIESLFKNTIQGSENIESLKNVYFLRNNKGDPRKGFKIVKSYFTTSGIAYSYLEINYGKKSNEVGFFFREGHQLSQKYKHTFYLIPYFCPFEKDPNAEVKTYSRGYNCLWRTKL